MTLELSRWLRPTDRVMWAQASAEPQTLVELLLAQRHHLQGLRCFIGLPGSVEITPEHGDALRFESYCGTAQNEALHSAGLLEVAALPYSSLPTQLAAGGSLEADAVFIQVSAEDEQGRHNLGLAEDYLMPALQTARVAIAEVNDQFPAIPGTRTIAAGEWTAAVYVSRPPAEILTRPIKPVVAKVATHVASLVPDGATVQVGVGAVPSACLGALENCTDLGIHSGLIDDAVLSLIQNGAVTGMQKSIDRGLSVAGFLAGSRELFAFARESAQIVIRPTTYTHDPAVLAAHKRFVAINSAIEVDLTGQVNAETLDGKYVGGVGGAAEFLRAAARSEGGVPIIALPSTAGRHSRIVTSLKGPVSTARSDVGFVVTENGVASLHGLTLEKRIERMLGIVHPDHRSRLEADIESNLRRGAPL